MTRTCRWNCSLLISTIYPRLSRRVYRVNQLLFIEFSLFMRRDFSRAPVLRWSTPLATARSTVASAFLTVSGDFASLSAISFFDSFTNSFTLPFHMRLREVRFLVWRRRFAADNE